ncbi:hypothetical protein ACLK18_14255 [Escherichia coli]
MLTVIVVNKWDGLSQEVKEQVKERWTSVWASSICSCALYLCLARQWCW